MRPVFFLTDFGMNDYYVAAVKAVMLGICPNLRIIDITHEVEPFNIKQGAFILLQIAPFLPKGAVVLAVVDPGVGTERKAIVVKGGKQIFVAPDNGLVYPAVSQQGIVEIREIKESGLTLPRSGTFDARDIFGPVAAHIACGLELRDIGPKLADMVKLELGEARFERDRIVAEVLHVDRFGNVVTNIPISMFEEWRSGTEFSIIVKDKSFGCMYGRSYGELGERLGLIPGSSGYMELSLREKSAASLLGLRPGDSIIISAVSSKLT